MSHDLCSSSPRHKLLHFLRPPPPSGIFHGRTRLPLLIYPFVKSIENRNCNVNEFLLIAGILSWLLFCGIRRMMSLKVWPNTAFRLQPAINLHATCSYSLHVQLLWYPMYYPDSWATYSGSYICVRFPKLVLNLAMFDLLAMHMFMQYSTWLKQSMIKTRPGQSMTSVYFIHVRVSILYYIVLLHREITQILIIRRIKTRWRSIK